MLQLWCGGAVGEGPRRSCALRLLALLDAPLGAWHSSNASWAQQDGNETAVLPGSCAQLLSSSLDPGESHVCQKNCGRRLQRSLLLSAATAGLQVAVWMRQLPGFRQTGWPMVWTRPSTGRQAGWHGTR